MYNYLIAVTAFHLLTTLSASGERQKVSTWWSMWWRDHLLFCYIVVSKSESRTNDLQWRCHNRKAYGMSLSLYDQNPVTKKVSGNI